jgi:hypothetical protein
MNALLTPAQVKLIKMRIWYGELHDSLADHFECSLQSINEIARGSRWNEIEWPDGTIGALAPARRLLIVRARREAKDAMVQATAAKVKALLKEAS